MNSKYGLRESNETLPFRLLFVDAPVRSDNDDELDSASAGELIEYNNIKKIDSAHIYSTTIRVHSRRTWH